MYEANLVRDKVVLKISLRGTFLVLLRCTIGNFFAGMATRMEDNKLLISVASDPTLTIWTCCNNRYLYSTYSSMSAQHILLLAFYINGLSWTHFLEK